MKAALGAVAILAALGAVAIPQQASAAICTIGTVASYEALGGTGCSVGNLTFANFAYASTAGGSGAAVLDTNVVVVPIPQLNNNGLLFSSGGWQAFGGAFVDSTLFFTVTANKTVIEDATLAIAGGAEQSGTQLRVDHSGSPGILDPGRARARDLGDDDHRLCRRRCAVAPP